MRIGYVQTSREFGEIDANLDRARSLIGPLTADLLVLPELFATGYAFTSRDEALSFAELPGERTTEFLVDVAESIRGTVVAGFAERNGRKVYNSAVMVSGEASCTCIENCTCITRRRNGLALATGRCPCKMLVMQSLV